MEIYPSVLFEGADGERERAMRLGRFLILRELGFFGDETNIKLSIADGEGSWIAQVRRKFSNTYGDVGGCHPADIEVAAEMLGVFELVFETELEKVE